MAQIRSKHSRGLLHQMGIRQIGPATCALIILVVVLAMVGMSRGLVLHGYEISRDQLPVSIADDEEQTGGEDQTNAAAQGDKETEQNGVPSPEATDIVVHVDGAVEAPGVYRLKGPSVRVGDAVEDAGGLAEDADTTNINLAAPLEDGQKVYVPHEGEAQETSQQNPPASQQGSSSVSSGLININTATADELMTLPGIGEATARAIIEERENGGPFTSPEDIMRVSGIGEKKYDRLQGLIDV